MAIEEADARNKTFDETTLEIRFRLEGGKASDWTRVRGKVADWSKLAPQACRLLTEQLGQTDPEATGQYVTEMIVRRRQAEAELHAALPPPGSDRKPDYDRVAAAAKLDPTYEPAAYGLLRAGEQGLTYREDAVGEALRYLERFPQREYRSHRHNVVSRLSHLYSTFKPPENFQQIATLQQVVEVAFGDDINNFNANGPL